MLRNTLTAGIQPAPVAETEVCPGCGSELLGTYCHRCGEKMFHEQDLSFKHFVLHGLHELTHLDSRIFATLRYLFTRPGYLTQEYVAGRRMHYVRPLSLFLIACAVFLLAGSGQTIQSFDVRELTQSDKSGKMNSAWELLATHKHVPKELVIEQVQGAMHKMATSAQLANALAMAAILALFYQRRYFTGHLVFACHFLAFNFFALVLLSPLASAAHRLHVRPRWLFLAETALFVAYLFFAMRRIYPQGVAITTLKAIVTYGMTQLLILLTLTVTLTAAVIYATLS